MTPKQFSLLRSQPRRSITGSAAAGAAASARYNYLGQGTAANDLTAFTKHASDRYIYFGPGGNDTTGDGLSHATRYLTFTKAWSMVTNGQGDWLLATGGVSHTETVDVTGKQGRSALYPIVITSYDSTDPTNTAKFGCNVPVGTNAMVAKLCAGTGASGNYWQLSGVDNARRLDFIVHSGLYFYRPTAETDSGNQGIGFQLMFRGDGLLVENCLFLKTPIEVQGPGSGYNFVGAFMTNACVRRCGSTRAMGYLFAPHYSGIHSDQAPGLVIEDNVIDASGWLPGGRGTGRPANETADIFKHCLYIGIRSKNIVVRRNVLSRGSATGCQARGGATVTDNVFIDNPYGLNVSAVDYVSYSYVAGYGVAYSDVVCTVTGNLFDGTTSTQGATVTNGGCAMYFIEINAANAHLVQNNLILSKGSGYAGSASDLAPIQLYTYVNSTPAYDQFLSFAVNTTIEGGMGTNTGDVAITPKPCTITFDNNLIRDWGSVAYATNGSLGTNSAANSNTRTNNIWDNEAASGSNVLLSSVSGGYLAPTRNVAAYVTANGYASTDALCDYAALHPEVNWAQSINTWIRAGYNR